MTSRISAVHNENEGKRTKRELTYLVGGRRNLVSAAFFIFFCLFHVCLAFDVALCEVLSRIHRIVFAEATSFPSHALLPTVL